MKTFNVAKLFAVVALLVAGFAFGKDCATCPTKSCSPCEKKCTAVKLPVGRVEQERVITESCPGRPKVRIICKKEVLPCPNEDKTRVIKTVTCPEIESVTWEDGSPMEEFSVNSSEGKAEPKKMHKRASRNQ